MPVYSTLTEAVNDLQRRGYTDDLALAGHCLVCSTQAVSLDHSAFEIDEFHRFEGLTSPDDQSIICAISSTDGRVKGMLVNAYGPRCLSAYAGNAAQAGHARPRLEAGRPGRGAWIRDKVSWAARPNVGWSGMPSVFHTLRTQTLT